MTDNMQKINICEVGKYWNRYPADFHEIDKEAGTKKFFDAVRFYRYRVHYPFLNNLADFHHYRQKKVLEIGCGMGTDGASFALAGADYTGIDLTPFNVEIAKRQFDYLGVKGDIRIMNAEEIEFDDNTFDMVYSHGVIHHSPRTDCIVEHIHRVLKPGGCAKVMVYHKNSFRYYIEIMLLRRLGILMLAIPEGRKFVQAFTKGQNKMIEEYTDLLKKEGLSLLRTERFLTINTDTALNPLSKAYTKKSAGKLFHKFCDITFKTAYMDWRRLPVLRNMPELDSWLGKRIGWFLFIKAYKRK